MKDIRQIVKEHSPHAVKRWVEMARRAMAGPPIEDVQLRAYGFSPDDSRVPRLNLVLPTIAEREAFGGISTARKLLARLTDTLNSNTKWDVRIVVADIFGAEPPTIYDGEHEARRVSILPLHAANPPYTLPVRRNDIFISYVWWISLNLVPVLEAQNEHYGGDKKPLIHMTQDYEPAFYAFSSSNLLALQAYNLRWPSAAIVNSSLLRDHLVAGGHSFDQIFTFEPRIPDSLRPFLDEPRTKCREILIYGRPTVARNCFNLIVAALRQFSAYPEFDNWELRSVGMQHKPVPLTRGRVLTSEGKLSLTDYAQRLRSARVGLSLMASPHPSYPPLEMAHFGIRTITNRYAHKDLSQHHNLITSLDDVTPPSIADTLMSVCRTADRDPETGPTGVSNVKNYLSPEPFECLAPLAEYIQGTLEQSI